MERCAVLIRDESTDHGTRGVLTAGALTLHLMEPPDRDTRPNRSSIPTGLYEVHPHRSPRFGRVLAVADVPGRSHILIHSGNVGGDVELGLHSHTLGCLLPGFRRRKLKVPCSLKRALEVRVAGTRPGRAVLHRGRAEGARNDGRRMRQVARVKESVPGPPSERSGRRPGTVA